MNEKQSLLDIQREAESLYGEIEAAYGEITPELEEKLAANTAALMAKIDSYAFVLDMLAGRERALRSVRTEIELRIKASMAHQERLKQAVDLYMLGQDIDEIRGEARSVKRVKNPPKLEVLDEKQARDAAPWGFVLEEIEGAIVKDGKAYAVKPDKKVLKDAILKEGREIPGVVVTQGKRIETR